jgi:hypothetical protein
MALDRRRFNGQTFSNVFVCPYSPCNDAMLGLQSVSEIRLTLNDQLTPSSSAIAPRIVDEVLAHEQDCEDLVLFRLSSFWYCVVKTYLEAHAH